MSAVQQVSSSQRENSCTMIIDQSRYDIPQIPVLRRILETGTTEQIIDALKKVIVLVWSGEPANQLLMVIIRFVLPLKDRMIKKLLLLFWEVVDKRSADGHLLPEMILVCNSLMRDLNHPNEYIRGSTLRFLCKLKEPELIEPLIESIKSNLQQRHSYVRRNAVMAIYSIYKDMPYLIPDAGSTISQFLQTESDTSCKRNALLMLFNTHPDLVLDYLKNMIDQVASFGEVLQLMVLEMIKSLSRMPVSSKISKPDLRRWAFIQVVFTIMANPLKAPVIEFDASMTLLMLSRAPTAVRTACKSLLSLVHKTSDNNVRMIVLEKIGHLKLQHSKIMQELIMDILRVLSSSPSLDVVNKALDICLDLVTPHNIVEVVSFLKKDIIKSQSEEYDKGGDYRQILIKTIRLFTIRYEDVAAEIVSQLLEFLGDTHFNAALDVALFVREVMVRYPALRWAIMTKLLSHFEHIHSPHVFIPITWIIGEYTDSEEHMKQGICKLGSLLLGDDQMHQLTDVMESPISNGDEMETQSRFSDPGSKSHVLPDGTYATECSFVDQNSDAQLSSQTLSEAIKAVKTGALAAADYFLACAAATNLTKIALRSKSRNMAETNKWMAQVLLMLVRFVRLRNQTSNQTGPNPTLAVSSTPLASSSATSTLAHVDPVSQDWFFTCMRLLSQQDNSIAHQALLGSTRSTLENMICGGGTTSASPIGVTQKTRPSVRLEDFIHFGLLRDKRIGLDPAAFEDSCSNTIDWKDSHLASATAHLSPGSNPLHSTKHIFQLTGLSDSIYVEATLVMQQCAMVLETTIINRTSDTLNHLMLELTTSDHLKLSGKSHSHILGPHDKLILTHSMTVNSTEPCSVSGCVTYTVNASNAPIDNIVVLSEVYIDMIDYMQPQDCDDYSFRIMWHLFQWDIKFPFLSKLGIEDALEYITRITNMKCITQNATSFTKCGILAANLHAKTIFGEVALANLSMQTISQDPFQTRGTINFRSDTRGVADLLYSKVLHNLTNQAVH